MNMILATILLALSLTANSVEIRPLEQNDVHKNWIVLPAGLIIVEKQGIWILYSAQIVPCSDWFPKYRSQVIFLSGSSWMPACYLVDPQPVGYYQDDPSDPEAFDLEMIPLTERTGHE